MRVRGVQVAKPTGTAMPDIVDLIADQKELAVSRLDYPLACVLRDAKIEIERLRQSVAWLSETERYARLMCPRCNGYPQEKDGGTE